VSNSDYAGLVTRMAALTIDAILLAIVLPVIANGPPSVWESVAGSAPGWLKTGWQMTAALVPVLYFGLSWWGTGHTLGGMLFGTVVRRPDGEHLRPARALLRAAIGLLFPVIWLVGMISVLSDSRRRALHDRVFDTVVLRKGRSVRAK
jgi:uncharacterized RDD family membrane protein YckC